MPIIKIDTDLSSYLQHNTIEQTDKTTFDDGKVKLRMFRERIDGVDYLSISEIFIPGTSHQKGKHLLRLMHSLVARCTLDNLRLRFIEVYNQNPINRLEAWGIPNVTPTGHQMRQYQTASIPSTEELRTLLSKGRKNNRSEY